MSRKHYLRWLSVVFALTGLTLSVTQSNILANVWLIWPISSRKLDSDYENYLGKMLLFLGVRMYLNLEWNLFLTASGHLCVNAENDSRIKSWTIRGKYLNLN